MIAITFVMFPVVSQATFEGDRKAARGYIRQTLRYSTIFIAGLAVVLIAAIALAIHARHYHPFFADESFT